MKPEMRHKLAQLPFEDKIRKVGELIRLRQKIKTENVSNTSEGGSDQKGSGTEGNGVQRSRS